MRCVSFIERSAGHSARNDESLDEGKDAVEDQGERRDQNGAANHFDEVALLEAVDDERAETDLAEERSDGHGGDVAVLAMWPCQKHSIGVTNSSIMRAVPV